MKKIFMYLLSISVGFLLVLWVYDSARITNTEHAVTESSVESQQQQKEYPILEKMERIESPNALSSQDNVVQYDDKFTMFKEYITFFIVTMNSFFGMLLVAKQVFRKEPKQPSATE